MAEPAPKRDKKLTRLLTPAELAQEKFGPSEGLAVVHKTTLDLAKHYAESYDLDPKNPDVTVLSVALAFARHKEFVLMQELERDLYDRVLNTPNTDYGEALFKSVKTQAHRDVNTELNRLHSRAEHYHRELEEIRRKQQAKNQE